MLGSESNTLRILEALRLRLTVPDARESCKVLDFLMDVKDGQLADAFSRELKFFVNIAKKTKACIARCVFRFGV